MKGMAYVIRHSLPYSTGRNQVSFLFYVSSRLAATRSVGTIPNPSTEADSISETRSRLAGYPRRHARPAALIPEAARRVGACGGREKG